MSSSDKSHPLNGGAPQQDNNCPCSSENESVATPSLVPENSLLKTARVGWIDSRDSASGHALLVITLPIRSGTVVPEPLRLQCQVGGLSAWIEELVVSKDTIIAKVRLPDGINLQQAMLVELRLTRWSVLFAKLTITVKS